jgi:hypothetical protein
MTTPPVHEVADQGAAGAAVQELVATASVVVAQGFAADAPPLGLAAALPLGGGGDRARDRLTSELGFRWQADLRSVIERSVTRRADWLALPPLLLCGPTGVGRTHVARRVAELAGLPHVGVAVGGLSGIEQLRPSGCGPDLLLPSAPVLAMAVSRCANPVVSVYDVGTLDAHGQAELARMIDPETAGRWVDYACGATVDLRQVNWMVQTHEPGALVPPLLRLLQPVWLRFPEGADAPLHLAEVLAEAAIDLGVIERVGSRAADGVEHLSRLRGEASTARIYAAARQWLDAQFG